MSDHDVHRPGWFWRHGWLAWFVVFAAVQLSAPVVGGLTGIRSLPVLTSVGLVVVLVPVLVLVKRRQSRLKAYVRRHRGRVCSACWYPIERGHSRCNECGRERTPAFDRYVRRNVLTLGIDAINQWFYVPPKRRRRKPKPEPRPTRSRAPAAACSPRSSPSSPPPQGPPPRT